MTSSRTERLRWLLETRDDNPTIHRELQEAFDRSALDDARAAPPPAAERRRITFPIPPSAPVAACRSCAAPIVWILAVIYDGNDVSTLETRVHARLQRSRLDGEDEWFARTRLVDDILDEARTKGHLVWSWAQR